MRIRSWKCHPDFPFTERSLFRGCWEFELKQGENTIPHQHEYADEINIAIEGSGRVTVGEMTRDIHAGEVIFIPAGLTHTIQNPHEEVLRGITVETTTPIITEVIGSSERVSAQDIEEVIEDIPEELSESEALQLIIRLFDLAGHLSEQIESAVGLENETGYQALQNLEKKVMAAVVTISQNYENGTRFYHPRF